MKKFSYSSSLALVTKSLALGGNRALKRILEIVNNFSFCYIQKDKMFLFSYKFVILHVFFYKHMKFSK